MGAHAFCVEPSILILYFLQLLIHAGGRFSVDNSDGLSVLMLLVQTYGHHAQSQTQMGTGADGQTGGQSENEQQQARPKQKQEQDQFCPPTPFPSSPSSASPSSVGLSFLSLLLPLVQHLEICTHTKEKVVAAETAVVSTPEASLSVAFPSTFPSPSAAVAAAVCHDFLKAVSAKKRHQHMHTTNKAQAHTQPQPQLARIADWDSHEHVSPSGSVCCATPLDWAGRIGWTEGRDLLARIKARIEACVNA